jgi:hypothetical protein
MLLVGNIALMGHYISNLRDIQFNLFELLGRGEVLEKGAFAEIDRDTAIGMLDEVKRMAENDLAESFVDGDRLGVDSIQQPEMQSCPKVLKNLIAHTWMVNGGGLIFLLN